MVAATAGTAAQSETSQMKARERLGLVFLSPDAILGLLIGVGVYIASVEAPKLREEHLFDVTAGISVAILAVVVAAFAILAAFLTDEYMLIIGEALGDVRQAFEPYAVVAIVSGLSAFASIAGIFVWKIAPGWAQSLVLGVAVGSCTWAVIGTVQLVGVTAHHGHLRMRVPEIRAAARTARAEREAAKRSAD
jgi:hypothetical protein